MVFFFTSNVVEPPYKIFMGEDKHENEELIRWGWPEDVWFHVDKLSSAHVYLRLKEGESVEDVPNAVIQDCAQLVKANSIQGNKMNNIDVVYTRWANLKKTQGMDVGQVGFHKQKEVAKISVEKRINEIVNRLNKTKEELHPDFREERESRDARKRQDAKAKQREIERLEKEELAKRQKEKEERSYDRLFTEDNMTTNEGGAACMEDDFM